jgi:hypothetical protein
VPGPSRSSSEGQGSSLLANSFLDEINPETVGLRREREVSSLRWADQLTSSRQCHARRPIANRILHSQPSLCAILPLVSLLSVSFFLCPTSRKIPIWTPNDRMSTPFFIARHQILPRCPMIRKLKSGRYRLYSRKKDPKTGRRRNLGTFGTKKAAEAHERAVQYYKHH